jgi:tRNA pseudouridine synthase 8/2,5-diamino-6-(5-phospho-D-ribitylamino)-pyrimidin-4(3H)-one deaminase
MNPPEYIQIGIIRYVKDYYYSFKTYCKRRWIGQNLLEFFTKEFMQYTPEYYEKAIL